MVNAITEDAMAEGDDLMNLGPFIQNYVFNVQPLHNLSLIAKLDNPTNGEGNGEKEAAPASPKNNGTENGNSDVCRPIHYNGVTTGQSLPYKKRNWDMVYPNWSPPRAKPKFLNEKQLKIKSW